jgi:hypothetical protein
MSDIQPRATRMGSRLGWVEFDFRLARDGNIEPTDKALYAAIASFVDVGTRRSSSEFGTVANDVAEDVPTRKRLSECIGKSVDTVDRCITRLEQLGLLKVHRRMHPDNPKVYVPSEYELLPYQPQPVVAPAAISPSPRKRAPISATKRARILVRDGHRCRKCSATEDLTIDHIKHWSRGGSNADDNLRVLCRSCNSKRSDGSLDGVDA